MLPSEFKKLQKIFNVNNIVKRSRIEILLDEESILLETNLKEVGVEVQERLGLYFPIKETNYSIHHFISISSFYKTMNFKEIDHLFDQYGEEFKVHGGNNPGENRYGLKISIENYLFIKILKTSSLVFVNKTLNEITIINNNMKYLAQDTRRVIKDNVISRYYENKGWSIMHSGYINYKNKGILVLGQSGAGKTSLILNLCSNGAEFISNDRTFIKRRDDGLYNVKGWPENVNIGLGTALSNTFLKEIVPDKYKSLIENKNLWEIKGKWSVPLRIIDSLFGAKSRGGDISLIIVPHFSKNHSENQLVRVRQKELNKILSENLLTPNDAEHPHWTEVISLDNSINYETFIGEISKDIPCFRLNFNGSINNQLLDGLISK